MKKDDVSKYYRLLGHSRIEMRAIRYNGDGTLKIAETKEVNDESEFVAYCEKWNGQANVYAGINERRPGGTTAKDVIAVNLFGIDCDAIHPKDQAATNEELDRCKTAVMMLADSLATSHGWGFPSIVMTGNGYQLLYCIEPIPLDDQNRNQISRKIQELMKKVIKEHPSPDYKLDNIHDLPRILKVAGTMSVKGSNTPERPHRLSFFDQYNPEPSNALKSSLLSFEMPEEPPAPLELEADSNGKPRDNSRSGREYAEVCRLIRQGFPKDEIFQRMMAFKKWADSTQQYRDLTYKKALFIKPNEANFGSALKKPGIETEMNPKAIKILNEDKWLSLAEKFIEEQPIHYDRNGIFWVWDFHSLIWTRQDKVDIWNLFKREIPDMKLEDLSYILQAIILKAREKKPDEPPREWIQFKDKIINYKTGERFEPSPKYFVRNTIPWRIGNSEDTPKIDSLFRSWVEEPLTFTLYEILAYCCVRDYPIHRAGALVGYGRNGKSTFLNLIKKFLGEENVISSSLDTILNNRFETSALYLKLACVMGEVGDKTLKATDLFKRLTGGDPIRIEFKGVNVFTSLNYAKLLMSMNQLPLTTDKSIGFYSRWLIVNFNQNTFPEEKDVLSEIPDYEWENLAFKSVKNLKELIIRGRFLNEGDYKAREKAYEKLSDPFGQFIKESYIPDVNGEIPYDELYQDFSEWLKQNNRKSFTKDMMRKIIRDLKYENDRIFRPDSEGEKKKITCLLGFKSKNGTVGTVSRHFQLSPYMDFQSKNGGNGANPANLATNKDDEEYLPSFEAHHKCSICGADLTDFSPHDRKPYCINHWPKGISTK